jgi:hypothetical protein
VDYNIPPSVLSENLAAWYLFRNDDARDYASDAEYPDITWGDSTAYDGTIESGTTYLSSGGVIDFETDSDSGAYDINGEGGIKLSELPVHGTSNRTLMCWVKLNSDKDSAFCITRNGGDEWGWSYFTDGRIRVSTSSSGRDWVENGTLADGNWHHVSVVKNGSNTSDLKAYLDGSELTVNSTQSATLDTNSGTTSIGYREDGNDLYLDGIMDDFRFYNIALTQNEINNIIQETKL